MGKTNKLYGLVAVLSVLMLAGAAVTFTSRMTNASGSDAPDAQCGDKHEDGETNDDAADNAGTDASDTSDPGQTDGETNDDGADDGGTDTTDPGQTDGETNDDGTDASDPGQTDGETGDDCAAA